jgi:serine/threonine protein kinase
MQKRARELALKLKLPVDSRFIEFNELLPQNHSIAERGGGSGDIIRASWAAKTVVVKRLSCSTDEESVRREIDALLSLEDHPLIVKFYGFGCRGLKPGSVAYLMESNWHLVFECVEMGSVARYVDTMEAKTKWIVLKQIAMAMAHVHRQRFVHLDLKEQNVLLLASTHSHHQSSTTGSATSSGSGSGINSVSTSASSLPMPTALSSSSLSLSCCDDEHIVPIIRLCDFGMARCIVDEPKAERRDDDDKQVQKEQKQMMSMANIDDIGTIGYKAPEVLDGSIESLHCPTAKLVDIYAFGVVVCTVLAGIFPFGRAPSGRWNARPLSEDNPSFDLERLPAELAGALVLPCLSYKPADRPQSFERVLEIMIDLERTIDVVADVERASLVAATAGAERSASDREVRQMHRLARRRVKEASLSLLPKSASPSCAKSAASSSAASGSPTAVAAAAPSGGRRRTGSLSASMRRARAENQINALLVDVPELPISLVTRQRDVAELARKIVSHENVALPVALRPSRLSKMPLNRSSSSTGLPTRRLSQSQSPMSSLPSALSHSLGHASSAPPSSSSVSSSSPSSASPPPSSSFSAGAMSPSTSPTMASSVPSKLMGRTKAMASTSTSSAAKYTRHVGVVGFGGSGKSTLVQLAIASLRTTRSKAHADGTTTNVSELRSRFRDGVLWLTVGGEAGDERLLALQRRLIRFLVGETEYATATRRNGKRLRWAKLSDVQTGRRRIFEAATCSDSVCLVVLDDVWRREQLECFDSLAGRCKLLVTTRHADLLDERFDRVDVAMLNDASARDLLMMCAGRNKSQLHSDLRSPRDAAAIDTVLSWCRGLPLALHIAGSMKAAKRGRWRSLAETLSSAGRHTDVVFSVVEASVNALSSDARARFLELAVFADDAMLPVSAICLLWRETAAIDFVDAGALLAKLVDRSLVTAKDANGGGQFFMLHDIVREYAIKQQEPGALMALHHALLAGYQRLARGELDSRWDIWPADGYFYSHVGFHAARAEAARFDTVGHAHWLRLGATFDAAERGESRAPSASVERFLRDVEAQPLLLDRMLTVACEAIDSHFEVKQTLLAAALAVIAVALDGHHHRRFVLAEACHERIASLRAGLLSLSIGLVAGGGGDDDDDDSGDAADERIRLCGVHAIAKLAIDLVISNGGDYYESDDDLMAIGDDDEDDEDDDDDEEEEGDDDDDVANDRRRRRRRKSGSVIRSNDDDDDDDDASSPRALELRAIKALCSRTSDTSRDVRRSAIDALKMLLGRSVHSGRRTPRSLRRSVILNALLPRLGDREGDVRATVAGAIKAMASRDDPVIVDALVDILFPPSPSSSLSRAASSVVSSHQRHIIRYRAVDVLSAVAARGNEVAVLALLACVSDDDRSMRRLSTDALKRLATRRVDLGYAVDELLSMLELAALADVRAKAVELLAEFGDVMRYPHIVEALVELIDDSDSTVRLACVDALVALVDRGSDPELLDSLLPKLDDDDRSIRDSVIQLIAQLSGVPGDARIVDALLANIERHGVEPLTAFALTELAERGQQRVIDSLLSMQARAAVPASFDHLLRTLRAPKNPLGAVAFLADHEPRLPLPVSPEAFVAANSAIASRLKAIVHELNEFGRQQRASMSPPGRRSSRGEAPVRRSSSSDAWPSTTSPSSTVPMSLSSDMGPRSQSDGVANFSFLSSPRDDASALAASSSLSSFARDAAGAPLWRRDRLAASTPMAMGSGSVAGGGGGVMVGGGIAGARSVLRSSTSESSGDSSSDLESDSDSDLDSDDPDHDGAAAMRMALRASTASGGSGGGAGSWIRRKNSESKDGSSSSSSKRSARRVASSSSPLRVPSAPAFRVFNDDLRAQFCGASLRAHLSDDNAAELEANYFASQVRVAQVQRFVDMARRYGRLIVDELCLPAHEQSLRPSSVDGIEYTMSGITFRLAVDAMGAYDGRDELAMKAGAHVLKGLQPYLEYAPPQLELPLVAVVDCCGFRLVASSAPGSLGELVIGPDAAGRIVQYNRARGASDANALIGYVATRLNLRRHFVIATDSGPVPGAGTERFAQVYTPFDVVVMGACRRRTRTASMLGVGGGSAAPSPRRRRRRYAMFDMQRTMPPQFLTTEAASGGADVLAHLLRPELVRRYRVPLCSDTHVALLRATYRALRKHPQPEMRARHTDLAAINAEAREATEYLCAVVVRRFAAELVDMYARGDDAELRCFRLVQELHRRGINCRLLGTLASAVLECASTSSETRRTEAAHRAYVALLVEALARQIKLELRLRLRRAPSAEARRVAAMRLLNTLFGVQSPGAKDFYVDGDGEQQQQQATLALLVSVSRNFLFDFDFRYARLPDQPRRSRISTSVSSHAIASTTPPSSPLLSRTPSSVTRSPGSATAVLASPGTTAKLASRKAMRSSMRIMRTSSSSLINTPLRTSMVHSKSMLKLTPTLGVATPPGSPSLRQQKGSSSGGGGLSPPPPPAHHNQQQHHHYHQQQQFASSSSSGPARPSQPDAIMLPVLSRFPPPSSLPTTMRGKLSPMRQLFVREPRSFRALFDRAVKQLGVRISEHARRRIMAGVERSRPVRPPLTVLDVVSLDIDVKLPWLLSMAHGDQLYLRAASLGASDEERASCLRLASAHFVGALDRAPTSRKLLLYCALAHAQLCALDRSDADAAWLARYHFRLAIGQAIDDHNWLLECARGGGDDTEHAHRQLADVADDLCFALARYSELLQHIVTTPNVVENDFRRAAFMLANVLQIETDWTRIERHLANYEALLWRPEFDSLRASVAPLIELRHRIATSLPFDSSSVTHQRFRALWCSYFRRSQQQRLRNIKL